MDSRKATKVRKIPQASKKDKNVILAALLDADSNHTPLLDTIASIDPDVLKKSVNHILNADLDFDSLYDGKRSIDSFLQDTDTVFRFAPAPSGELHIGHVVPVLMNLILSQINKNYGRNSTFIVRIDDTDPDILMDRDTACAGISIIDTLEQLVFRTSLDNVICYRSSDYIDPIVKSVLDSIRSSSDRFYPDLTPQNQIKVQRASRQASDYRDHSHAQMCSTLDQMIAGDVNGVIRAKIDAISDNGNLRDPVMIRILNIDGTVKFFPTYDLVCPVLDLFDSLRFKGSSTSHTLLALRDCNYYDRFDQYMWIQNALSDSDFITSTCDDQSVSKTVANTSMLTFSRISIENALLSKRKIKALIAGGVVGGWADPRLFTLPGIMSRGFSLAGLANFYWVAGTMSTSNRASIVTYQNFFAHYDKVVCKTSTPILNRLKSTDVVPDHMSTIYDATVISYQGIVITPDSTRDDVRPRTTGIFKIDLDQIVTDNLMNFKKCTLDYQHLNTVGVDAKDAYDTLAASDIGDLFWYGTDMKVGTIVKINNFKDDDSQTSSPGFYLIRSIDHDTKQIVFSSISN